MKRGVGALLCGLVLSVLVAPFVLAIPDTLLISEVQTRTSSSASEEFIELYNASADPVDVTHWCVRYETPTTQSTLGCIEPVAIDSDDRVFVQGNSFIFFTSKTYQTLHPLVGFDVSFSLGMSEMNNRAVVIVDEFGSVIDAVEWAGVSGGLIATLGEGGLSAPSPTSTQLLARRVLQPIDEVSTHVVLQDTDNNAADFELRLAKNAYSYGALYEVSDVCVNLGGFQLAIPDNYTESDGICTPPAVDMCENIDGIQEAVPEGYAVNESSCLPDICLNIDGVQIEIPGGYKRSTHDCLLDLPRLELSELLPNPAGDDSGREFIELYNPNPERVPLDEYVLILSGSSVKHYSLMGGAPMRAYEYRAIYSDSLGFSLTNTTLGVAIWSSDGQLVDAGTNYEQAKDDFAWAKITGSWQYTNRPTPYEKNLASVASSNSVAVQSTVTLKPCAPNQFRNPETNRCKRIVSASTSLTPCAPDQYRNPETNRCKKLASVTTSLTPCNIGFERNPETNRCRKVAGSVIPVADYAVSPVPTKQQIGLDVYVLIGVIAGTASYALWEWREEIRKLYEGIVKRLHP